MKFVLPFVLIFNYWTYLVVGGQLWGTANINSTKYDYGEVIRLSNLFYEAQRSGKLPAGNRIPWRGDSALKDGLDVGMDLSGGYYDAGDFVKFGFTAAQAMTTLAWGGISYKKGYQSAGEWHNLLATVKWGTDYFIKCHASDTEFYGQVGDGYVDHDYWGRPEEMPDTMSRPSFKITESQPGSDLAGETAASLAAASILFQEDDPDYSAVLLDHAISLYDFADKYRGKYSDAITNAAEFYESWSYHDELVWGAAWLYKASGESKYLSKAEKYYDQFEIEDETDVFSWDDKSMGCKVLLAELTGKNKYIHSVQLVCDNAMTRNRSPGGEVWWSYKWGSLRYAANSALICLQAADIVPEKHDEYLKFAQEQIAYILGGNGQSFVVGYGPNWPKQPHHAAASCPDVPAPCDWDQADAPGPNPQILNGALVGGPDKPDDKYNDKRSDYTENEVTLDYNAGFQSAVAGLHANKYASFKPK